MRPITLQAQHAGCSPETSPHPSHNLLTQDKRHSTRKEKWGLGLDRLISGGIRFQEVEEPRQQSPPPPQPLPRVRFQKISQLDLSPPLDMRGKVLRKCHRKVKTEEHASSSPAEFANHAIAIKAPTAALLAAGSLTCLRAIIYRLSILFDEGFCFQSIQK